MTTFAVERYADVVEDIKPLAEFHWNELATYKDIPLDIDYEFYEKANDAGLLWILTGRNDRRLVAYALFVVRQSHPRYRTSSWAINDVVWVRPDERLRGVGRALVDFWEQTFIKIGITGIHVDEKIAQPALGILLRDCGYVPIQTGWEKRL